MNTKFKTALFFGFGITFILCTMSFISILKKEDETFSEIIKSFTAALAGGLGAGIIAYFFANKLKLNKLSGKKD